MRKAISVFVALLCAATMVSAQSDLRYNYKKNGYIYSGCARERVDGSTPVHVKLNRIMFPDGQPVYQLRLDFEERTAWKMPKNAPITIRTVDGKSILLKNSADAPNLVAPEGIKSGKETVYLNYGEYYLEEADLKKIASGVASIDVTKCWSSDGYIKVAYKNNELGSVISSQYSRLKSAPRPAAELGNNLKSLQDQRGSRLAESVVTRVNDRISAQLIYLYYAESNNESVDLNLYVAGKTVPFGAAVTIATKSGETISLQQEKELTAGRIICYPTPEQYEKMLKGVAAIYVETSAGPYTIDFSGNAFTEVLSKLYNSIMTVAVL